MSKLKEEPANYLQENNPLTRQLYEIQKFAYTLQKVQDS